MLCFQTYILFLFEILLYANSDSFQSGLPLLLGLVQLAFQLLDVLRHK